MRKAAEYTRRIKQLFSQIRKAGSRSSTANVDEPMALLLLSILSNYASETRAAAAVARLRGAMVDYNELRVTSVAEIVATIGVDYPRCRAAAEEISRVLRAVFNRLHHLDLEFLKTESRRSGEQFLDSLDGISAHAKAMMVVRCLGGHAVPLDARMFEYLIKGEYLPADTSVEAAHRFLASRISARDTRNFHALFKKYASTHSPRASATKKGGAAGERKAADKVRTRSKTKAPARRKRASSQAASGRKKAATRKTAKNKTAKKKKATRSSRKTRTTAKRKSSSSRKESGRKRR